MDIHCDDVGAQPQRRLDGFPAIVGRADDDEVIACLQQSDEQFSLRPRVLDDQHADWSIGPVFHGDRDGCGTGVSLINAARSMSKIEPSSSSTTLLKNAAMSGLVICVTRRASIVRTSRT